MTELTLTYKASDGSIFTKLKDAEKHQALLTKIERFMDAMEVPAGARAKTRRRIVAWTEFDDLTTGGDA